MTAALEVHVRDLEPGDVADVVRIDALHTGTEKPSYWRGVFDGRTVALAAEHDGKVVGYLFGEVRAFEFGSEACGWIFAVGVEPGQLRGGIATKLMARAIERFEAAGIHTVRTMVRRNDVPVLAFFRASGFAGGSFVQLERDIGVMQ